MTLGQTKVLQFWKWLVSRQSFRLLQIKEKDKGALEKESVSELEKSQVLEWT